MSTGRTLYRISVNVPEEFLERMMDAVTDAVRPVHPGYERTFSYSPVTGTWRPLEGSSPYRGTVGRIETAEEIRLEFAVGEKDLKDAVRAVADIHPYEEPAIDVIPMTDWKDLL